MSEHTKKSVPPATVAANLRAPTRRQFLGIGASAVGAAAALPALLRAPRARADVLAPQSSSERQRAAYDVRKDAATWHRNQPAQPHPDNGDEARYADRRGSFSKGLPHHDDGTVNLDAYAALLAALASGDPAAFGAIPTGPFGTLENPMASYRYSLVGADPQWFGMPAAPALASAWAAGELVEVYWQALTRDVPFRSYGSDSTIARACNELTALSDFRGPKQYGRVTAQTLFRGDTPGDTKGFYVSQFLLKDVPYGPTKVVQRYRTRLPGYDQATSWNEYLDLARGNAPEGEYLGTPLVQDPVTADPVPRYIRNGRDLAEFLRSDWSFQAYSHAALICMAMGKNAIDTNNPYYQIGNQTAFVTFGGAFLMDLVARVANAALAACWFQKWLVHRRLRPEAMGALLHQHHTGTRSHPLHADLVNAEAPRLSFDRHGTFLLSQAYRVGSPRHPSYPAGHATVAGACVTVLKAYFNENFVIKFPVVPDLDGLVLEPLTPELGTASGPTIGDELNKLAANMAIGRDTAGVHYRSDGVEGILLGEQVAISILRDLRTTMREPFDGFSLTRFDGTKILV